jgi:hypothetical protein
MTNAYPRRQTIEMAGFYVEGRPYTRHHGQVIAARWHAGGRRPRGSTEKKAAGEADGRVSGRQ